MFDKNALLADGTTAQTGTFTGAWFDLASPSPFAGETVRVLLSALSTASGNATLDIVIEESANANTVAGTHSPFPQQTFTGTTANGDVELFGKFRSKSRYVRIKATLAGGTTPSYKIKAGIVPGLEQF